ncbi:MAG: nuclear transport factor 2 family protein [Thermomicrobiales bacterium]
MVAASPLSIAQDFEAELNDHDLDRVVACFTEDAVVTFIPSPPPTLPRQALGKAEIRQLADRLIPGFQIASRDYALGTHQVTLDATVSTESLRSLGIAEVDVTAEVAVTGGKVSAFTLTFTDDAISRMQASV